MNEELANLVNEILNEIKGVSMRLDMILEAFKSWQSQDEHYHNRAEKILKGEET